MKFKFERINLIAFTLGLVIVSGIATPAFAQLSTGGTPTPGAGAFARTSQINEGCIVIDFEGVGDFVPAGTIGDVTFSATGLGLVDLDAGGSGNFANEPSPNTVLFSIVDNVITATLANPVNEISWNYVSPFPAEIRIFGPGNVLIAIESLPAIPQTNPGDPTGEGFGTWSADSHDEDSNVITYVEYDGVTNNIAWDDLNFCEKLVGGTSMSIDTTALLLAGAQANAVWMLSALAVIGSVAFGTLYLKTKRD